MRLLFAAAGCALMLVVAAGGAQARPDLVELYAEAVRTADAAALERLLAPNYWHISSNGHIQDKEHFIAAIRTGKLAVKTLRIRNVRASMAGKTLVVTGNGLMRGVSDPPLPEGLMRYTLVLGDNGGRQQVVLFQATPVIPSAGCEDGNCALR